MNAKAQTIKDWPVVMLFVLSALFLCAFLFYIDEGNYHFKGLFEPMNLIAMAIYFVAAFLGQAIVFAFFEFVLKKRQPIMAALIGAPIGVIALMLFFWFG